MIRHLVNGPRLFASDILDRVKHGGPGSEALINRCLVVTGDIPEPCREEAAHFICPIKTAHDGMDEMLTYHEKHLLAPTTSRAPARLSGEGEA